MSLTDSGRHSLPKFILDAFFDTIIYNGYF
jgi:hypothetical protein